MFEICSKYRFFILAGILILAFFLRFHNIGKHGLAGDEKYSLFVSQFVAYEGNNQQNSVRKPNNPYFTPAEFWSEKSINDFFDSIARVDTGNGALYTYTLHFWSKIVGLTDGNLRLLSLIFNLLTILLLYYFVIQHFESNNLALLSSFLATISPFYINFSQVARNYAMQFFFALLSTHILLLIVEKFSEKQNVSLSQKTKFKLYVLLFLYGLTVLASELCHISTFPLFLIHGFYILFFKQNFKLILALSLSMSIPLLGLATWLNSDGGKWLFEYVAHSTDVYNQMAISSPDDYLSIATVTNIFKQIRHVVSCSFISLEGLYLKVSGIKTLLLILGLSGVAFFIQNHFKNEKLRFIIILIFSIGATVVSPFGRIQGFVLFANIILFQVLLKENISKLVKCTNSKLCFLILLITLPFVFLILFAWRDGNTFRIIPRYVGYSYAFGLILTAMIIRYLFHKQNALKYFFGVAFLIQMVLILNIINDIWQDTPPRYFMGFSESRKRNPYEEVASRIIKNYSVGDTIVYCSSYTTDVKEGTDMPQYSVVDAQLTNFYLPKNSNIIQRVNPAEKDKIFIIKKDKTKQLIYDLEGSRYRY